MDQGEDRSSERWGHLKLPSSEHDLFTESNI